MSPFLQMQSLKRQLFFIALILLLVPVLVMLYDIYFASKTDDILIVNLESKLTNIVGQVSEEMSSNLARPPEEKQPASLEEIFNAVAAPIAHTYPGVRLGLYIIGKDKMLIQGFLHEFRILSPEEQKQREQRIYNETKAGISAVMNSGEQITRLGRTWDDQFLEHLVPIKEDSQIIAVVWAEEMMHPLFAQSTRIRLLIRYVILIVFGFGVLASLLMILTLTRQVSRIKGGLLELEKDFTYRLPEMPGEIGQITGAINTLATRLTEREQLLEQLRRSENLIALGRLITNIAHELRNPVSIVQATIQALEAKLKNSPELKEYVAKIEEQVARQNRLVGELLDFGRPDPGIIAPLDLNALLSGILQDCSLLFQQRAITLEFAPSAGELLIEGNQEKLKQVFLNLILNAVQAMPQGGTLNVQTYANQNKAVVVIRDTGTGIPTEELARIFEPFYTKKAGGTGLGLAISQRIVQIHGGSISVASESGAGTTFTLSFPGIQKEEGGTLAPNT